MCCAPLCASALDTTRLLVFISLSFSLRYHRYYLSNCYGFMSDALPPRLGLFMLILFMFVFHFSLCLGVSGFRIRSPLDFAERHVSNGASARHTSSLIRAERAPSKLMASRGNEANEEMREEGGRRKMEKNEMKQLNSIRSFIVHKTTALITLMMPFTRQQITSNDLHAR